MIIDLILFRLAAIVFSLRPPMGSTFPVSDNSPVIAKCGLILLFSANESRALAIVMPADGPSFGVAPAGM